MESVVMKKSIKYFCLALSFMVGGLFSADAKMLETMEGAAFDRHIVLRNLEGLLKEEGTPEGLNKCLGNSFLKLQKAIKSASDTIIWETYDELFLNLPEALKTDLVELSLKRDKLSVLTIVPPVDSRTFLPCAS